MQKFVLLWSIAGFFYVTELSKTEAAELDAENVEMIHGTAWLSRISRAAKAAELDAEASITEILSRSSRIARLFRKNPDVNVVAADVSVEALGIKVVVGGVDIVVAASNDERFRKIVRWIDGKCKLLTDPPPIPEEMHEQTLPLRICKMIEDHQGQVAIFEHALGLDPIAPIVSQEIEYLAALKSAAFSLKLTQFYEQHLVSAALDKELVKDDVKEGRTILDKINYIAITAPQDELHAGLSRERLNQILQLIDLSFDFQPMFTWAQRSDALENRINEELACSEEPHVSRVTVEDIIQYVKCMRPLLDKEALPFIDKYQRRYQGLNLQLQNIRPKLKNAMQSVITMRHNIRIALGLPDNGELDFFNETLGPPEEG
jgi:hypothetical protein